MDRLYCTVSELLEDLEMDGVREQNEARILDKIKAASAWIEQNLGQFIPSVETRRFDGDGSREMYLGPILSLTALTVDDISVPTSDVLLYPRNKLWENGPYMRLVIDLDATTMYYFTLDEDNVVISGKWGAYENTVSSGASTASQADDATSLVVDDASGISVGAVLLIEEEQELVTAVGSATDSTANLNGAMDADDEEITVTDASVLHIGEVIKIGFEQMKVFDITGNDVLVLRGWNRTKRTTHADAADVYVYRTFTVSRGVNGTTAAEHTSQAISRYVPPADILWLCKQMAALMLKKADSAFSGRVGNAETGETFYLNEFPNAVIDKIRMNYFVPLL